MMAKAMSRNEKGPPAISGLEIMGVILMGRNRKEQPVTRATLWQSLFSMSNKL